MRMSWLQTESPRTIPKNMTPSPDYFNFAERDEYLANVLAERDSAAFLIALKDVVDASGGVGELAGHVRIKRPSLYKILSKHGNPTLDTLQEILKPLGLGVSVVPLAKCA